MPGTRTTAISNRRHAIHLKRRWIIYLILGGYVAFSLLPLAVLVADSFREYPDIARRGWIALPVSVSLDPFVAAWTQFCVSGGCHGIQANFYNSLAIAIPPTLFATALGALNGYVLTKWRFPGSELVFGAMVLGVFMPPQTTLLPWAFVLGALHLYDSIPGLVLIHCVQGLAFTTLFCRNYFIGIPDEIIKAARVDGAGFWRIYWKLVLPMSAPILIVSAIWEFTGIWNEFLYGVVFTGGDQQPVTAALRSGPGSQSAATLIAALPPLLVYLVGGRYFVQGLTRSAFKG